jgi:hypothetical protein
MKIRMDYGKGVVLFTRACLKKALFGFSSRFRAGILGF